MPAAQPPAQPGDWSTAQVRRLQILSSRLVTGLFAGEYRSVFRGMGIEFEEVRAYQPGDDVRRIDWNVTARTGHPFVKQYVEARELSVMLLLDRSASLDNTTPRATKGHVAAEVCALLAFAAEHSHDRVGLLTFTDRVEHYVAPAKGIRHTRRLLAEALQPPTGRGTRLASALDYLQRVQRRRSILFIISDFQSDDFLLPLAAAARQHDVVAVSVSDPLDDEMPNAGLLWLDDAETGTRRLVDTGAPAVRRAWQAQAATRQDELRRTLSVAGVEHLTIASDRPPVRALEQFFRGRQRRRHHGT